LRHRLLAAIDGKGAFRRFKDVLMNHPVERERWFTFRSERLRACMESWLSAHGIEPVERPEWRVPTADEVKPQVEQQQERPGKKSRAQIAEAQRKRLHELVEALPARELDAGLAFLEFLRERKHIPRPRSKSEAKASGKTGAGSEEQEGASEQGEDDRGGESAAQ
jgi:hypothetical protein